MNGLPRIVLDTSVLVRGLCRRRSSASWSVLREVLACRLDIVLSLSLFLEYEDVLHRVEIVELLSRHGTPRTDIQSVLVVLADKAHEVQVHFRWRPNLVDADDNHVLETALHSHAVLVTCNPADFAPPKTDLLFPKLRVMTPAEFVKTYLAR